MRNRTALVVSAVALLTALPLLAGGAPAAQANYCGSTPFPPSLPNAPQGNAATLNILGAYNHVGGAVNLSGAGCVDGEMVHDTRVIPPRADFVRVYLTIKCKPGATFTGGTLRGLGVNDSDVTLTCMPPNAFGHTWAMTGTHYLRSNLAGKITATLPVGSRTLSTTSYTALPVSQPA